MYLFLYFLGGLYCMLDMILDIVGVLVIYVMFIIILGSKYFIFVL